MPGAHAALIGAGSMSNFVPADGLTDVSATFPGLSCIAVLTLNTDGTQSGDASGSWGTPTTTGIGSSYEVYVSYTGDAPTGITFDTWIALSSTRSISLTATTTPGNLLTKNSTLTVSIRPNSGATSYTATVLMDSTADATGL